MRDIGSAWICNLKDGHTETWHLEQSGWRVSGQIKYLISGKFEKTFSVQGIVRSNYFTGTYWSDKTDEMSIGSFTFEIQNDNDKLVGTFAGYNPSKNSINCVDCILEKQDSKQDSGQVALEVTRSSSPNEKEGTQEKQEKGPGPQKGAG
jgi:hypothetical protein